MSIRDRIPFFQPKVRPVGTRLERGESPESEGGWKDAAIKTGLIGAVILASLAAFPRGMVYKYTATVDSIWKQDNLHAPFRYAIQKPEEVYQKELETIRQETPPIFNANPTAAAQIRANRDSTARELDRILGLYESFQTNKLRGRISAAVEDSAEFVAARASSSFTFGNSEWNRILDSYSASVPGLESRSRSGVVSERLDRELLNESLRIALQLNRENVANVPKDSIRADRIRIRNDVTIQERTEPTSSVLGAQEAFRKARQELQFKYPADPIAVNIAGSFFSQLFVPNLRYDREATQNRLREARNQISQTYGIVRENEVIVRRGDIITEEIQRRLISLEQAMNERSGTSLRWGRLLGQFILAVATFLMFFLYLYLLRRNIYDDNRLIMLITLLFLGVIGAYGIALRAALVDMYVVPVVVIAILLTVIFDSRVGLFGTLTLALMGSHLLNFDFAFTFATLFAGTLGIFSVRDIRNRGQFFLSAGVVLIGYVLILTATWLLQNKPLDRYTDELIFVAINSILILLAYPLLWVFERTFDITTDLTLLELSDTNRPLLKELSLKATGTFNHVLQVANLAEAAATAVRANALLTRVGALYHDIGKMIKPEYFVENQRQGSNPHDGLKPRMSALIIASHVKEGIEIGRKYKLPQEVLDFIPMHHGTTRIEYFYRRALDQQEEGNSEILESEFRYPGPKPNTRETGILMLADSVEAASRTLENPTHKRLENLIDSIVDARRDDGQLDDTNLTFADIDVIKNAFLNVLMGIYHVRVKYPEDEEVAEPLEDEGDLSALAGRGRERTGDLPGQEATDGGVHDGTAEGASDDPTAEGASDDGSNNGTPADDSAAGPGAATEPGADADSARLGTDKDSESGGDEAADSVERGR